MSISHSPGFMCRVRQAIQAFKVAVLVLGCKCWCVFGSWQSVLRDHVLQITAREVHESVL
jgi:hypothetical protein